MNIEIGRGLSNIIFGMKEDEIIKIIGSPDKIITCEEEGREFLYNFLKLKLFFDFEENNRLYSIKVFRNDITFLSTKVIGMALEELLIFMKENGYKKYEIDQYDYFDVIYFDECNTYFTIEFNEVTSLEFSPLFNNDDEIVWPSWWSKVLIFYTDYKPWNHFNINNSNIRFSL